MRNLTKSKASVRAGVKKPSCFSTRGLFCITLSVTASSLLAAGENIAVGKPTQADSVHSGYVSANAVDGVVSDASRWLSTNTNDPHWLEIDLAATYSLNCATLYSGWENGSSLANFELQYWTGSAWNTIPGADISGNSEIVLPIPFNTVVSTNKVRLYTNDDGYQRVKELELYEGGCISVSEVYLNQSGFNLNETKRFTAPTSVDGTAFEIRKHGQSAALYSGTVSANIGDFTDFNPTEIGAEYVVMVGSGNVKLSSVPFGIGYYWNERVSYRNAVDFMVGSRCYVGTYPIGCENSQAWRDAADYAFEVPTLVAQYASNPSAYENMASTITYVDGFDNLAAPAVNAPDVVKLIHWGIGRYQKEGCDRALLKEQLAFFLYVYPDLKGYIAQTDYDAIEQFAFNRWANANVTDSCRTNSRGANVINHGANLLNVYTEIGTAKGMFPPGHSIMPNLMMYEVAKREGRTDFQDYFDAAYNQASWMISNLNWQDYTCSGNVAQNGLATADSTYSTYLPANAIDGVVSNDSRWLSANTNGPHWLEVAFPQSETLQCAKVVNGWNDIAGVENFELQYWDSAGGEWKTITGANVSNNDDKELLLIFSSPVSTDKVRLYSTDNQYVKIKELELFTSRTKNAEEDDYVDLTKGQRMSEHVTMEGLAFFQKNYPSSAPAGLLEYIEDWAALVIQRSDNMWDFRKYDDGGNWVVPAEGGHKWNEPGNVAGLPAALYSAIQVLSDQGTIDNLRRIAVAQLDSVFGRNPTGRHFSHDAPTEVEGVEMGWFEEYQGGLGQLGDVTGVLDGSPKPTHYPYIPNGDKGYTEGWVNFNTAWNASLAYCAHDKTSIAIYDENFTTEISTIVNLGTFGIELTAPLNFDYNLQETGHVVVTTSSGDREKLLVTETSVNGAGFRATITISNTAPSENNGVLEVDINDYFEISYGLAHFKKAVTFTGNGSSFIRQ